MRAYWSRCANGANFGDVLTPWLFAKLGVELQWTKARFSELIGCGSIIEHVPEGYTGIVLGAGMMYAKSRKNLRAARVLALRGSHTKERCALVSRQVPILGDLGLTMAAFCPDGRTGEYRLGDIPHYAVYPEIKAMYDRHPPEGCLLIDVLQPVDIVIAQAARCERIVSSSLHGLILADCLGIPSMWLEDERVLGNGFKFIDYASAFGEGITPGAWRQISPSKIAARSRELLDVAHEVAKEVEDGT